MEKQPVEYAMAAVETMMRKFRSEELPPKGRFHYHQGVFLSGVYQTYRICGKQSYMQYIKEWVDSCIDEVGNVRKHDPGQLDDIQPGILLFPLLEVTGDQRYKCALDTLVTVIRDFPRNARGGFWHKTIYPDQMWLDGLYMGGPICAEYGARFHKPEYFDLVAEQALLMEKVTKDDATGLLYHAWDCSKRAEWADPDTGCSSEFWGRSMGWVPVAVLDELDYLPRDYSKRLELQRMIRELLTALCRYQSSDGRWYQVVDKGGQPGNWLENSCTCLYTAAICKAVRKGILDSNFLQNAKKGYDGVIRSLHYQEEDLLLGEVCVGTCVGDYSFYINRPSAINDLHGVGAFLIMCCEAHLSGLCLLQKDGTD